MKPINLICLFLILLFVLPAYSQDNADYFPYKKNNYWEYLWLESCCYDTIVSFSVFDTTDSEGRKIAVFDSYFINPIAPPAMLPDSGTYIIDSSLNVFSNYAIMGYNEYELIYKLNGIQGEQWVMYDYSQIGGQGYEMARITEINDTTLFGLTTKLMWIFYYYATDSTDTIGLGRGWDALMNGLGLYFRQREGWPGIGIKGAVIDGVLYGDTTTVGLDESALQNQPSSFQLYQNFPNPFNPITTIFYSIPKNGLVTLKVYDILGTEVTELLNEVKETGSYSVTFNAADLPSGIYFYTLKSGNFTATKKLILLK
jgi:hypothetical protein